MKKTITICLTAAAFFFAACSNSAGGSTPYVPTIGNGTTQTGGENGGGNSGGQQTTQTPPSGATFYHTDSKGTIIEAGIITGEIIYSLEILEGSGVVEIYDEINIEAKSAGVARVKAVSADGVAYNIVFTVTESQNSGGSQSGSEDLASFLVGTWKCQGSNYSGTLTLNSDKTGHLYFRLPTGTPHDTSCSWNSYSYNGKKYLVISGTGSTPPNGNHEISTGASSFTFHDYFAFGAPSTSTWTRQ